MPSSASSSHMSSSVTVVVQPLCSIFFFFNDTATTEIYTLSLHDALPISKIKEPARTVEVACFLRYCLFTTDRKSTRLNSSHQIISYAVFCLKKKKKT